MAHKLTKVQKRLVELMKAGDALLFEHDRGYTTFGSSQGKYKTTGWHSTVTVRALIAAGVLVRATKNNIGGQLVLSEK